MRIKYILILIILTAVSISCGAEEYNKSTAMGFHFGSLSGSGYAMRWMGEKMGLQATLGGYTYENNEDEYPRPYYLEDVVNMAEQTYTERYDDRESAVNFGLNYIHVLDKFSSGRFYVTIGGSYKYFYETYHTVDYALDSTYTDWYYYTEVPGSRKKHVDDEHRWTVGAGPGVEFWLGKKFSLAMELPITFNWKKEVVMYMPQVGVYYYFK